MGLRILALASDGVELAQAYRREPRPSLPNTFAALAKTGGHFLLAGDASLREQAGVESVECHGVLWIFDALQEHRVLSTGELARGLQCLAAHSRCRLPRAEIQKRIQKYEQVADDQ